MSISTSTCVSCGLVAYQLKLACFRQLASQIQLASHRALQRDERKGWMGDSSLTADTVSLAYDMCAFFENWVSERY